MCNDIQQILDGFYSESSSIINMSLVNSLGKTYQEISNLFNDGYNDDLVKYHPVDKELRDVSEEIENFIYDMQYTKASVELADEMYKFLIFCATGILSKTVTPSMIKSNSFVGCKLL